MKDKDHNITTLINLGMFLSQSWSKYLSKEELTLISEELFSKKLIQNENIAEYSKSLLFIIKLSLEKELNILKNKEKMIKNNKNLIKKHLIKDIEIRRIREFDIIKNFNKKEKDIKIMIVKNYQIRNLFDWCLKEKIIKKPFLNLPFLKYRIVKSDNEIKRILNNKLDKLLKERKKID